MSNKIWDRISYAQSEAANNTAELLRQEEDRQKTVAWWVNAVKQSKHTENLEQDPYMVGDGDA